ncbi:MAG: hypothetical protein ACTHU0_36725 [Kofleriaceae bacterium]
MQTLFYDDQPLEPLLAAAPSSIFLAGPTARRELRTPWRLEAMSLLERRGFSGAIVIPEFRSAAFEEGVRVHFGRTESPVPHMRGASYDILDWETCGIERSTIALFWMPFRAGSEEEPDSLPGFTTRAEVSRELARAPHRIVLGMPPGAFSSSHIRYHAFRSGVMIHDTLVETVDAAMVAASRISTSR